MKIQVKKPNAVRAFRVLLALASTVFLSAAFLCAPLPPSANAEDAAPIDSGQVVHTWKSKLIKSDKTLLEIVKEEAPNIEVLPLQGFFYYLFEVTIDRYLPFYRLKEAAVLATYEEAAECLEQIGALPSKEKACALFALTIFENKYRPRPQDLQEILVRNAGAKEVPYFPYHNLQHENPLELWTSDYEPNAAIPSTFWERWEQAYQESFTDERPAFAAGISWNPARIVRHGSPSDVIGTFERTSQPFKKNLQEVKKYAGDVKAEEFLYYFNVRRLTYYREEDNNVNPVVVQILQAFEDFESNDVKEIQTVYALREFLLLQTYQTEDGIKLSEVIGDAPIPASYTSELAGMNSSYHEKTVSRIARELQTLRLCYDGSFQLPDPEALSNLEKEYSQPLPYVSAWEVEYKSRNKTLLDVVKEEAENITILPSPLYGGAFDRALTFERFLPVYRLEEAAKFTPYNEALECVAQFDSLSSKEKACALYALAIIEFRNDPRFFTEAEYTVYAPELLAKQAGVVVSPVFYAIWTGQYRHSRISYCQLWDPPYYWSLFDAVFARTLDDKETAFPALVSEDATSEQATKATRSNEESELASAWTNNIAACAELAQNYVGGNVSEADFLAPIDPITFYILILRARNSNPKEPEYDRDSFTFRFIKGVENVQADFYKGLKNLSSDDYAEMQKAYALFEYWARLHTKTSVLFQPFKAGSKETTLNASSEESNRPTSFGDSSRRAKTVGDVANELQKLRLERKSLNTNKNYFYSLII